MGALRAGLHGTVAQSTSFLSGGSTLLESYGNQRLIRAISTSGNRRTWTMSAWMKIVPSSYSNINHRCWFGADAGSSDINTRMLCFVGDSSDQLQIDTTTSMRDSSSVYRDPTGWYHHVIKLDTAQSAARDQLTYYINGSVVDTWNTESAVTQNQEMGWNNSASTHLIGANQAAGPGQYFAGYLSDMIFCDSAAFDASYFGYTDPLTGIWRPKNFKQTNGFGNPNDGTVWSSNTCSGTPYSGQSFTSAFDGLITTYVHSQFPGTLKWVPDNSITGRLRCYIACGARGSSVDNNFDFKINGVSKFNDSTFPNNTSSWVDFGEVTIAAGGDGIEWGVQGANDWIAIRIIEIDGYRMVDSDVDNSFYLPFDGSAPIGEDQSGKGNDWLPVSGSNSTIVEKATGALPILNTVGGGKIGSSGLRIDADKDYCTLALSLAGSEGVVDVSHLLNSGSAEKTVTVSGPVASNTISNLYGSSYYFDGSSDFLSIASNSELAFGTGDFTIEFWAYMVTDQYTIFFDMRPAPAATQGVYPTIYLSGGTSLVYFADSSNRITGDDMFADRWYHIAVSRVSSQTRMFLNGIQQGSTYSDSNNYLNGDTTIGCRADESTGDLHGYMQDVRCYKGVGKYTQNFLVPVAGMDGPSCVPDSPAGVSLGSVLTVPSTGGSSWINGNSDQISVPYTADAFDWTSSSTDFCVESWNLHTALVSGGSGVWAHGTGGGFQAKLDVIQHSGYPGYCWNFEMLSAVRIRSDVPVTLNKWTHVACVMRSGTGYLYVDGVQQAITGGHDIGAADTFYIGRQVHDGGQYRWNGLISNFRVVTGSAVYTGNFTPPTAPLENITNTKLLCLKDPRSVTSYEVSTGALTASGNGLEAVSSNPFESDVSLQPTKYPTLNPLCATQSGAIGPTYKDGLLYIQGDGDTGYYDMCACASQLLPLEGKFMFEYRCLNTGGTGSPGRRDCIGVYDTTKQQDYLTNIANSVGFQSWDGDAVTEESDVQGEGAPYSEGDYASCAIDCATGQVWFATNGCWVGNPTLGTGEATTLTNNGSLVFCESNVHNTTAGGYDSVGYLNFGQKPFAFTPPEGFGPLCAANDQQIARPQDYQIAVTYAGNNGINNIDCGFAPDLVMCKAYSGGSYHWGWYDTVRGAGNTKGIYSSGTEVEGHWYEWQNLQEFLPTGFKLGATTSANVINGSGYNMVAYAFKAGGNKGAFNRDGVGYATAAAAGFGAGDTTINGASVGTKQGFSIIHYTGPDDTSNHTVAHGLNQAPDLIFTKNLDDTTNWNIYLSSFDSGDYMTFTADATSTDGYNGAPTSTVINTQHNFSTDETDEFISYCWHNVPGLQKVGKYVSNNNAYGPMVLTGFRPSQVVIRIDGANEWNVFDNKRNPTNGISSRLYFNTPAAQQSSVFLDFLSDGFKLRTNDGLVNGSATSYYYIAWADQCASPIYGGQSNAY